MLDLLLIAGGVLLLAGVAGFWLWLRRDADLQANPAQLDAIVLRDEWRRCMIRAVQGDNPARDWRDVRVRFSSTAGLAAAEFRFPAATRTEMQGFESRLALAGWVRQASGSSDQLSPGFDRPEHAVLYLRQDLPA